MAVPHGFSVAFLVLWIGTVCTVGAQAWQPYRPMMVQAPAPYKVQDRVSSLADLAAMPLTCATIRALANGKTRAELEALANQYGLTRAQRRAAWACLRSGNWS